MVPTSSAVAKPPGVTLATLALAERHVIVSFGMIAPRAFLTVAVYCRVLVGDVKTSETRLSVTWAGALVTVTSHGA